MSIILKVKLPNEVSPKEMGLENNIKYVRSYTEAIIRSEDLTFQLSISENWYVIPKISPGIFHKVFYV